MTEVSKDERKLVMADADGAESTYNVADMSDEAKVIYTKLDIISKNAQTTRTNLEFELEKLQILQKHYLEALQPLLNSDEEKAEEVEEDEQKTDEETESDE